MVFSALNFFPTAHRCINVAEETYFAWVVIANVPRAHHRFDNWWFGLKFTSLGSPKIVGFLSIESWHFAKFNLPRYFGDGTEKKPREGRVLKIGGNM